MATNPLATNPQPTQKGRVFLMDTMSFIFRAYHAMARQRPMSTKKGVPTAATYVFVNMLRKLRADFNPEYLAAVFDVAGPTFRDEQAKAVTSVRKFDIKTQTFKDVDYLGYKAQRAEMPQLVPRDADQRALAVGARYEQAQHYGARASVSVRHSPSAPTVSWSHSG